LTSRRRNIAPRCGPSGTGRMREVRSIGVHLPLAHRDAVLRETAVGAAVRLVVLIRHDDFVARLQSPARAEGPTA
jgi:hypothetical protein